VELATARAKCLGKARKGKPSAGAPSIACELEYMSFASGGGGGGGGGGGSGSGSGGAGAGAGAGAGEEDAAAAGQQQPPERRGILTLFLNRGGAVQVELS
jgi:hypothetical protein